MTMKERETLNDNNYIEALLEKFSADGNIPISSDNIFTILDKEWDERTHCRILFFLIKYNSDSFADFISENSEIDLHGYRLSPQESCCEASCRFIENCKFFGRDKHGFIDILLVWENKSANKRIYMPIEVKLGAGDQPLQLIRYYYHFSSKGKEVHPIYLTTSGKNASETSIVCPYENECDINECPKKLNETVVTKKSFNDIYENWLKNWLNKLTNNAENDNNTISRELIKHYCEILQRWYKMGEYINLIKKKKDSFIAAKNIYNSFGGMIEEIRQTFFDSICDEAGADHIELLPYKSKEQKKQAKQEGWSDSDNIEVILNFDGTYLAVCVADNLYCSRKKDGAQNDKELDEWCYIKKDWFETSNITNGTQKKNDVINGKRLMDDDNYIVEWYYMDSQKRKEAIEHLVANLKRYALRDINLE